MPDEEWVKTLEDLRRVKFIYQELPEDSAFITAQIEGNEVVYSVVLTCALPVDHQLFGEKLPVARTRLSNSKWAADPACGAKVAIAESLTTGRE